MDIVRRTEIQIAQGLRVEEQEAINNEGQSNRTSHHFVQIGDGSSDDFRIGLNTNEQRQAFFDLYDALGMIVEKLRGW